MSQWEFDLRGKNLLNGRSLHILGLEHGGFDNLNGRLSGSVSSRHVIVHLLNRAGQTNVSEFLVHVVRAGARIVSKPNRIVLYSASVLVLLLYRVNYLHASL